MIPKAIEQAKELLDSGTATQSQIDAMAATLKGRMEQLVEVENPTVDEEDAAVEDGNVDENIDSETDTTEATDAPIVQQPIVQQPIVQQDTTQAPSRVGGRGCGAAVTTTAVVVSLVATLGTAMVVKKKD